MNSEFKQLKSTGLWVICFYGVHAVTSLAYEVIWIKRLGLTLGMSLPARGLVLAMFVAGMGVGAYSLAMLAKRRRLSVRMGFAALQVTIGIMGILLPWAFAAFEHFYESLSLIPGGSSHEVIRIAGAALLLLPPTALIGAAFPLLTALWKADSGDVTLRGPSILYFVGLVASGVGALLPVLMIPHLGLTGSSSLLGIINIVIGVTFFWLRVPHRHPIDRLARTPKSSEPLIPFWMLLCLGGLVGFLIFGMEVTGAQYIWLIVNATPHAEALVLCVALLGMALGSGLSVVCLKRGCPPTTLLSVGIAVSVVWQLILILMAENVARQFDSLISQPGEIGATQARMFIGHIALAAVVVGGPAAGYGFAIPGMIGLAGIRSASPADPIGRFWAWHNWGALLGALVTTFLLIPCMGLTISLAVLSALGIAAFALTTPRRATAQWKRAILLASSVIAAPVCVLVSIKGDLTFREASAGDARKVIFHHEDGLGVVEVMEERSSGYRFLLSNRLKQEGGTRPEDIMAQRIQGYLPILLHERPHNVLVVGLGTGISLGSLLREEVKRVTVVEISRGIIKAAPLFVDAQNGILRHPKVSLIEDDGRHFIRMTKERYDLIVQDLFFPYQSGVGTLYTIEHYQRCRERLSPGGMMAQWITINQVGPEGLHSLIRTFQEVFPHTTLWLNGGYLLLFGGLEPLDLSFDDFMARYRSDDPLGGVGRVVADPYDFLGRFISTGSAIREWVGAATINTEETSFIEYNTPRYFATINSITLAIENLRPLIKQHQPVTVIIDAAEKDRERLDRISRASQLLLEGIIARGEGRIEHARKLYEASYALNSSNYQVRTFLGSDLANRGRQSLIAGHIDEAKSLLGRALAIDPSNHNAQFDMALVHAMQGEDNMAVKIYQGLLKGYSDIPHLYFNMGVSLYRLGRYKEASVSFGKVIEREPFSVDAHFNLANALARLGQFDDARVHYRQVLLLDPDYPHAQENLEEIQRWVRSGRSVRSP